MNNDATIAQCRPYFIVEAPFTQFRPRVRFMTLGAAGEHARRLVNDGRATPVRVYRSTREGVQWVAQFFPQAIEVLP